MKISDLSNINKTSKPFLDTILALTIDFSMDVIAIRIDAGLWNWKIKLTNTITFDSFIGVRYGNFIGWYFIVLIYSCLIRFGREKYQTNEKGYAKYLSIIPILGLIPFYIIFESIQQGKRFLPFDSYFMMVVILLILVAGYQIFTNLHVNQNFEGPSETNNLIPIELLAFYSFHVFFLIALIVLKIYNSAPLIIVPSILAILIHYIFHDFIVAKGELSKRLSKRNVLISN